MDTLMQSNIEKNFTSAGRYDRDNTARLPYELQDTATGLQIALLNMDICNDKIDMDDVLFLEQRLERMTAKFKHAGIPISVITSVEGFNKALDSTSVCNYDFGQLKHLIDAKTRGDSTKYMIHTSGIPKLDSFHWMLENELKKKASAAHGIKEEYNKTIKTSNLWPTMGMGGLVIVPYPVDHSIPSYIVYKNKN